MNESNAALMKSDSIGSTETARQDVGRDAASLLEKVTDTGRIRLGGGFRLK